MSQGRDESAPVKVLFLAANPALTTRLALDEERREIEQKVRASKYRDALVFQSAWAVRPDDLLHLFNEHQPQVVHFSGHGSERGLRFAGEDGASRLVTIPVLKQLFAACTGTVRLVFLNACSSRVQAQALLETVDCVIDMKEAIHDVTAATFASSFYSAIGFGHSVQTAFDQGLVSLKLSGIAEAYIPELLVKEGIDAKAVVLIPTSEVSRETPSSSPAPDERAWNVPYTRNLVFTGREQILEDLAETFQGEKAVAVAQPQAISGLGGIGKTQIAVEYAYRHRQEYQCVLWTLADTREALISSYVMLATLLHLPVQEEQDQQVIVHAVKAWLSTHANWLLLLDNADDLALLHDFLPSSYRGHILLTTRAHAMGRLAKRLEVDTFSSESGALLLLRRASILCEADGLEQADPVLVVTAREISEELGGLPLALDQAGAYIEETQCSFSDYQQRYHHRRMYMLSRRGELAADYPASVVTTWSLAFEKVEQTNPAAADLLRLCAFLAPDAIPEEVITGGAAQLGLVLEPVVSDPIYLDEALAALGAYSLMHRNTSTKTFLVHRLVQAVLLDQMGGPSRKLWAERAVHAVNSVFPPGVEPQVWSLCERYLPHALLCVEWVIEKHMTFLEGARLLNQTASYLRERTRYLEAEPLYLSALAIREQELGAMHPATAASLNNLALFYQSQGKYEQEEPLLVRALSIDTSVYGENHPDVATDLDNLALLYKEQGKYFEAEPLYLRALTILKQTLGPAHPNAQRVRANYASLLRAIGREAEAATLDQDA